MIIGVLKEVGENRVCIVPEVAEKLIKQGYKVVIEKNAGNYAGFSDADYKNVGASVSDSSTIISNLNIFVTFNCSFSETVSNKLKPNSIIIGMLNTRINTKIVQFAKRKKIILIDLTLLPRTISKAQSMDVLSSQANLSGYKASLIAANQYNNYFPMMTTAAGMFKPARVLVIGTGVAGLQALATCKRLGAITAGYDIRKASESEVKSVGAEFICPKITIDSKDGYARKLTAAETEKQLSELGQIVKDFNVIITTAAIPGKKPPLMIKQKVLSELKRGTVIVDMASSKLGGNVEGSKPDKVVTTKNGVKIIGAYNLPALLPNAASTAFANNIMACVKYITKVNTETKEVELNISSDDELTNAIVINYVQKKAVKK